MPQPSDETRDLVTRGVSVRAATINEENRTVDVVIATEGRVEVYDWDRDRVVEEVLRIDGGQFPAQIPLLEAHQRWDLSTVLGSARHFRDEALPDGTRAKVGTATFAKGSARADEAWNMLRQGHLTDFSVGYRVHEATEVRAGEKAAIAGQEYTAEKRGLRVATKWSAKEVSLVPIGADPRAKARSDDTSTLTGEAPMDEETKTVEQEKNRETEVKTETRTETTTTQPDPIAVERDRVRAIYELAAKDIPAETVQRAITDGWTLDRATTEFLRAVRAQRKPDAPAVPYHQSAHTGKLNGSARQIACGLMAGRGLDPTKHVPHDGSRASNPSERFTAQEAEQGYEFRAMSSMDVMRACIHADTGRWPLTVDSAFDMLRSTPTSGVSLSYAFTTNIYASLLAGWETVGDTTAGWCDEEDVANFLVNENISFEANARPKMLPAGATAQHATASDSREQYSCARYALQFVMDEQTIINDRLNALAGMAMEMGEGTRAIRAEMVYAELLANPTMGDTGALFNATAVTTAGGHANLTTGSGGALAASALKVGIAAVMAQRIGRTADDPGRVINAPPRYLLAPSDLKWTADDLLQPGALVKLFADSADPVYSQRNPFAQMGIVPVIDDRLGTVGVVDPRTGSVRTGSATAWYLTTGGRRGMRVIYRRGTGRQPQMRSFALVQGQWGMGYDINFDIGCKVIDYRSWYKANGA